MLSRIEIDPSALGHNFRAFAKLVGHERLAPVLKSNAYGHGLEQVYQILAAERPAWLCVNYVAEAERLRSLGYQGRILVVGPAVVRELPKAANLDLDLVIGSHEILQAWLRSTQTCRLHVKFDTGMGRQGFLPHEASLVSNLILPKADKVAGICTHFANVEDVTDHGYAQEQLRRFDSAREAFRTVGLSPMAHAASSASSLILGESRLDLHRVGISLYGCWPSSLTKVSYLQINRDILDLRPVLSWRSEITTLKSVGSGEYIGYGCTFRTVREMRIAVVPVGYYEGYPRIAGEQPSYVLVHGHRCPIVGRICMNMMMVDTTHLAHCQVGDAVTLIGQDGGDTVSVQDVSNWARTIHYEVLSRLHPDIPRQILP